MHELHKPYSPFFLKEGWVFFDIKKAAAKQAPLPDT
jgi:hypothetical protein